MSVAFGEFEIDPAQFELRRADQRIPLEPQAFDVLSYLVDHRDRLVSKEELMDQIWAGRVRHRVGGHEIKQVRRAVDDDGRAQRVIRTVHGRGYRFVASVAGQDAPPGAHRSATSSRPGPDVLDGPIGPDSKRGVPLPVGDNPAVPLLGRDHELAVRDRLFAAARAGYGALALVSGEPGIGKSALLAGAAREAEAAGATVLRGRAVDGGGPYQALGQALMDPGVRLPSASLRRCVRSDALSTGCCATCPHPRQRIPWSRPWIPRCSSARRSCTC